MNNFEEETNFEFTLFQNKELFPSFSNINDYNLDESIYSTEENTEILNNIFLDNKSEESDDKSVFQFNRNNNNKDEDENSWDKNEIIQNLNDEQIFPLEENNQILKKKRGRKKIGEKRGNINHSNYDNDNIIYKMKVQSMKCINELITNISEKNNIKIKLNKIEGSILKDGKKSSNINLLEKSIKDILLMNK